MTLYQQQAKKLAQNNHLNRKIVLSSFENSVIGHSGIMICDRNAESREMEW